MRLSIVSAIKYIFLLQVMLCIAVTSSCQIKLLNGTVVSKSKFEVFIRQQIDSFHLPGVSIAFISNGTVSYQGAFGYANLEKKRKATINDVYEACSMSKPLFAYYIMLMQQKGILNLDTPLYKYLAYPDIAYDERYKLITARMVLSHTSGLPNWHEYEPADSSLHLPKDAQYLKFTPGSSFNYSGEGYHYLVNVIAHLRHTSLFKLKDDVYNNVCKPLKMKHAVFGWNDYIAKHKVTGYRQAMNDGNNKRGVLKKFEEFSAAGGLHCDAADYAKFVIALMKEEGLTKSSFADMFRPQVKVTGWDDADFWGLGLGIKQTPYGTRYMHSGNNGDFTCYFVLYKEQQKGFVFFTNCNMAGDLYDKLLPFFENGTIQ
ncbi:MAG: hypothetical protein JWR61_3195 [Ferruginibacter sp.]|uniref:serine hydrolase domain-containing protein n=1 Tax=Ferruginibacter sp. TaxID=1940288 RepID=UPI002657D626|nr:serine hydrolase domain-containing protein [Ferruginibacter sp.]MDB5278240.1 hypothetical protein [Ferruginibacter sp.]